MCREVSRWQTLDIIWSICVYLINSIFRNPTSITSCIFELLEVTKQLSSFYIFHQIQRWQKGEGHRYSACPPSVFGRETLIPLFSFHLTRPLCNCASPDFCTLHYPWNFTGLLLKSLQSSRDFTCWGFRKRVRLSVGFYESVIFCDIGIMFISVFFSS